MKYLNNLIRVTEAAAISASKWVGSGNKEEADKAATEAMRDRLNKLDDFTAKIVIGEGKKDSSYGLFCGEMVGNVKRPSHSGNDLPVYQHEIAVDPIEGTTPTVNSGPEAISVMAVADKGSMWTTEDFYAMKLAYGPKIASKVKLKLEDPIEETVKTAAKALGKDINEMMVCILNRTRHDDIIKRLRKLGCRIKLIQDCDVSGAVATCLDKSCSSKDPGIDLLYGIGGAPEAVISAAAIKCLKGDFQCQVYVKESRDVLLPLHGNYESQLYEKHTEEDWKAKGPVLGLNDLIKGHCIFVATGITPGSILEGVHFTNDRIFSNSCFMRSESGTVRFEETWHGN